MHFEEAVTHVLIGEGGYLEASSEPGGCSMMGVSLTVLQEFRKDKKLTCKDLQKLEVDEAKLIYKKKYWDKMGLDAVPGKLSAIILLDQAVNRGVAGLKKQLVYTLNKRYAQTFADDAKFEDMLYVVSHIDDRAFFIQLVSDTQDAYVRIAKEHPEKASWLPGWLNRTQNLLKLLA
jgi:lysozyme family protein